MWERTVALLDWPGIAFAAILAALTISAASYPVPGTDAYLFAANGWSVVAIAWAAGLTATTQEKSARAASMALLGLAVASIPLFGFSLALAVFGGPVAVLAAMLFGLALLAVV